MIVMDLDSERAREQRCDNNEEPRQSAFLRLALRNTRPTRMFATS